MLDLARDILHLLSMSIDVERYARHLVLREIGGPGQQALARADIGIVGAGGLGSPAALYLAAAGVGRLRLVDPDVVSLSNLQRQVLFQTDDVGKPKVERASDHLNALNPALQVDTHAVGIDDSNASELLQGCDLVLDGCDNFPTRFAVDKASRALGIPLVSGAVGRWDGQLGVFNHTPASPCYRCWVPAPPPDAETCAAVGIVGALTGIIGSMMALEAIKLVCEAGDSLDGRMMLFDGLSMTSRTVKLTRDPACCGCGN